MLIENFREPLAIMKKIDKNSFECIRQKIAGLAQFLTRVVSDDDDDNDDDDGDNDDADDADDDDDGDDDDHDDDCQFEKRCGALNKLIFCFSRAQSRILTSNKMSSDLSFDVF